MKKIQAFKVAFKLARGGRLAVLANSRWGNPGNVNVHYFLCCPYTELLSCNDSHDTVIQQQSLFRGLFRLVVRLTVTGDVSCPKHHYPQ